MVEGDLLRSHQSRWIVALVLVAVVATWYVPFVGYTPFDYGRWLHPWYEHIVNHGRVGAFERPFGNYTPPYLYLLSSATFFDGLASPLTIIKMLSAIGAGWLSYAVFVILASAGARDALRGAAWSLLLPTLVINVPMLAQADPFWVAPSLLAVAAGMTNRTGALCFWSGVAFAIKAQAIFLAPFVVAILIKRRSPLWYWAIPIAVYLAAMLPAWAMGWPASDLATVYLRQVAWVPADGVPFVSNAANWWLIFRVAAPQQAVNNFWIGYLLAAAGTCLFVWFVEQRELSPTNLILAAAISSAVLPWLLPGMHERFFALAEILAFCLAWTARDRTAIAVATLMQVGLCIAVSGWLAHRDEISIAAVPATFCAIAMMLRSLTSSVNDCGQADAAETQ